MLAIERQGRDQGPGATVLQAGDTILLEGDWKALGEAARARDVLLVEDIVDTGRTIAFARAEIARAGPRSLRLCALLDKPARREVAKAHRQFGLPLFGVASGILTTFMPGGAFCQG